MAYFDDQTCARCRQDWARTFKRVSGVAVYDLYCDCCRAIMRGVVEKGTQMEQQHETAATIVRRMAAHEWAHFAHAPTKAAKDQALAMARSFDSVADYLESATRG